MFTEYPGKIGRMIVKSPGLYPPGCSHSPGGLKHSVKFFPFSPYHIFYRRLQQGKFILSAAVLLMRLVEPVKSLHLFPKRRY